MLQVDFRCFGEVGDWLLAVIESSSKSCASSASDSLVSVAGLPQWLQDTLYTLMKHTISFYGDLSTLVERLIND